jgi:hypothetical protein
LQVNIAIERRQLLGRQTFPFELDKPVSSLEKDMFKELLPKLIQLSKFLQKVELMGICFDLQELDSR